MGIKVVQVRHDRVGQVIHWELCKSLKFDHSTKWYRHRPDFILENEMYKILWSFEIQSDRLTPSRKQEREREREREREKTRRLVDFFLVPANYIVKIKESEEIDKYLDLA